MPRIKNKVIFRYKATITKIVNKSFALAKTDNGLMVLLFFSDRWLIRINNEGEKCIHDFSQTEEAHNNTGIYVGTEIVFSHHDRYGEDDWEVGMWIPLSEFQQHAEIGDALLYITRD